MSSVRRYVIPIVVVLVAAAATGSYYLFRPAAEVPREYVDAGRPARITPDYSDCSIPSNIAPLNFVVKEAGRRYRVRIYSERGDGFVVAARTPQIVVPPKKWRDLLALNRGNNLHFDIYVRDAAGPWIAAEDIDPYLGYRLINPARLYRRHGVYQRDLTTFDESPVLASQGLCVNCHTFANNDPDTMILHIRGKDGVGMLLVKDGTVTRVDTRTRHNTSPAAYASWHPSGRVLAFSVNKLIIFHHEVGDPRDVFDFNSDLGVYLVGSNRVAGTRKIADPNRLEVFPAWSHDGRHLYFSSTPRTWTGGMKGTGGALPMHYREICYDLMRIPYDIETGEWGELETVLSAEDTGMSILEPRASPDGRFLLFCMCEYGSFPVYQRSSDLYMMDLKTRRYWPLEKANTDRSESWHSWSMNSRWIVFASRRSDGLFGKLYFSYIDQDGQAHKPFLLPQKDPTFYDSYLKAFSVPELMTERISVKEKEFLQALLSSEQSRKADAISGATPKTVPPSPTTGPGPALDPYERR